MNGEKFNIPGHKPRILVSPLEWGLGHATRCVPIIKELLRLGCEVFIAAGEGTAPLLKKEFPQLQFLTLNGYRMRYSRKKIWLPVKLLLQFPKMLYSIYNEHRWLKKMVKEHALHAVISDNRFGLYHRAIPCIYITHQLTIETGNPFTRWMAQKIHYRFINRYTACWVPDAGGAVNLAGKLSHPKKMPVVPVQYIGPLSRFEKQAAEKIYDLLICISGPEPQRTVFEKLLLNDIKPYTGRVMLIRGLPGNTSAKPSENNSLEIHDHLPSAALNKAIEQSKLVISRSGYTSIMDYIKLQQPAVLVPTPGQKEQEYLAIHVMEQRLFFCVPQHEFSLQEALNKAASFSCRSVDIDQTQYAAVVQAFVENIIAAN